MQQDIIEAKKLLEETESTLIAHYYTDPKIQLLAEQTGGCISDSLVMAEFGAKQTNKNLVIAGVKFMGETAKILSPEKKIIMPSLEATCSLDLGCEAEEFNKFCNQFPDRTIVVYANTSAAVKARADWVVTSSIALDVIDYLDAKGEKIIWGPDKHLGTYIQKKTGADMKIWNGSCIVHDEFKKDQVLQQKKEFPNAIVLVHPESPQEVIELADVVGSTSQLLNATKKMDAKDFIVATDMGIFYKMQQASPEKNFIPTASGGKNSTCKMCSRCPWMKMNSIELIKKCIQNPKEHEVFVDPKISKLAKKSLDRMINFSTNIK